MNMGSMSLALKESRQLPLDVLRAHHNSLMSVRPKDYRGLADKVVAVSVKPLIRRLAVQRRAMAMAVLVCLSNTQGRLKSPHLASAKLKHSSTLRERPRNAMERAGTQPGQKGDRRLALRQILRCNSFEHIARP